MVVIAWVQNLCSGHFFAKTSLFILPFAWVLKAFSGVFQSESSEHNPGMSKHRGNWGFLILWHGFGYGFACKTARNVLFQELARMQRGFRPFSCLSHIIRAKSTPPQIQRSTPILILLFLFPNGVYHPLLRFCYFLFPMVSTTYYYHLLPPTTTYYHLLPSTATYHHLLPSTTIYCHLLPSTATYYHLLPPTTIYYHLLPSTTTTTTTTTTNIITTIIITTTTNPGMRRCFLDASISILVNQTCKPTSSVLGSSGEATHRAPIQ